MGVRKIFYFNDYVEKFLLDDHPAVFAISKRQLSSTAIYALVVRRSSDNEEKPIPFRDGFVYTGDILAFVGSGTGYVSRIYNQGYGGSQYDAVQPNTNLQPIICQNGTMKMNSDTGKADEDYDGSKFLTVDNLAIDFGVDLSPRSSFVVSKHEGNIGVDDRASFAFGSTFSDTPLQIFSRSSSTSSTSVRGISGGSSPIYMGVSDSPSTRLLVSQWMSNGTGKLLVDSSLIQTVSVGTISFPLTNGINRGGIGAFIRSGVTHQWKGNISEVIFRTEIDEVGREAITNNIANFYDIDIGNSPQPMLPVVDVIAELGQSNMEGRDGDTNNASYPFISSNGYYWKESTGTVEYIRTDRGGAISGSHANYFCEKYYALRGIRALMVECSAGGTGLTPTSKPNPDNWSSTGALRQQALTQINTVLNTVGNTEPKACLWNQGERDALTIDSNVNYTPEIVYLAMKDVIDWWFANYPNSPFIISELGDVSSGADSFGWQAMRTIQNQLATEYSMVHIGFNNAKTFGNAGKMIDQYHYNYVGYKEMGESLATLAASL